MSDPSDLECGGLTPLSPRAGSTARVSPAETAPLGAAETASSHREQSAVKPAHSTPEAAHFLSEPSPATPRRRIAEVLAVTALYFATARLGLLFAMPGGHVTPLWPPSGIALAAIMLLGRRVWLGVWLGSFLANYWDFFGGPMGLATGLGVSATLGIGAVCSALLGEHLLRITVGLRNPLAHVRDVCIFMGLGGMVTCALSATVGVTTLCVGGVAPWSAFNQIWLTWWLGDAAGVFVFTPLLLAWLRPADGAGSHSGWEAVACYALLGLATAVVFILNTATLLGNLPLAFLVIPFLVWPAIRFRLRGATAAIALITVMAVWGTIHGAGPFHSDQRNTALLLLELFLSVVVLTALFISAIIGERHQAEAAQLRAMDELESRVRERTAELEQANQNLKSENTERARSEAAHRESERRMREMLENVQLIAVMLDAEGRITFCNSFLLQLTGWSREDALGSDWFARFLPNGTKEVRQLFLDSLQRGTIIAAYENPIVTKTGELRLIRWSNTLQRDPTGSIVGTTSIGEDITERQRDAAAIAQLLAESEKSRTALLGLLEDQKLAEAALQAAAESQTAILNALPAHIALLNREGDIVAVNESWRRFASANTLMSRDFFVGQNYPKICEAASGDCSEEAREVAAGLRDVLAGARPNFTIEYPCHSPQEKRWFRLMACPLHEHAAEGAVVMHVNVTERRLVEDALRKSEASLAAAQTRARIGNWELSLAEQTGTWSAEMYTLFDRAPALGAPTFGEFLKQIHPEDREKFGRDFSQAMGDRRVFQQDFRIVWRDGSIHWIEGRGEPVFDAAGQLVRLIGTSQDITERKDAEAALRESEERFRQLTENIGEVFWITDAAAPRTLYVSPAYEAIWGRSCRSLYDSPSSWHEAIYQEDRERIRTATAKMVLGTYDEEYRITRPDGTLRWIHDKAFPLKNENGAVTRIVGVAEDITEHRHLEAQFRQAQKMEAIGTLAGGIAHDFNNILGAVKGYAQLAQAAAPDRLDLQEHLDAVLQGTNRAADLVKQIITFSRQNDTQHSPVRLHTIVTEALSLLRATIPTTVEIKTVVETEAPPVLADATQIHQVVMNLCTNAWHAMKSRPGRLEVRVEAVALDAAFAQAHPELKAGPHLRLTVADTGCGMDQATLSRIFEPFFTTKGPGEGSGLGLAVVHGIMSNHRGAIVVQSEPDVGTTFQLYFPAHAGAGIPRETSTLSQSPHGNRERILLVDDELPLVRLGTIILEKRSYTVRAFTSSTEALAALRANPDVFDLVVSDLAMPEMSGLDLATEIRSLRPDLPIILTSGYVDQATKEIIRTSNIQHILLKPFTVESLSLAVHQVLAARRKN